MEKSFSRPFSIVYTSALRLLSFCNPFLFLSFLGFQQFSFLAQRHLEDFIRKKGKEQLYIITRLVRVSLQLATIYLKQVLRGAIYSSRLCNCYIADMSISLPGELVSNRWLPIEEKHARAE